MATRPIPKVMHTTWLHSLWHASDRALSWVGPARNPSSVQRGSVNFLSFGPGDPTTPGYASKPGVVRQDPSRLIPSIPSLPISFADAIPILAALNHHGLNASDFGPNWRTGGLGHKGVAYSVGPAAGIALNLVNQVDYEITPMWNVIGKIPGFIADETVILGNHRDAWIAGGAADPNSGSAALNEMARSFGKMLQAGWKPARTLLLASWDGEEVYTHRRTPAPFSSLSLPSCFFGRVWYADWP